MKDLYLLKALNNSYSSLNDSSEYKDLDNINKSGNNEPIYLSRQYANLGKRKLIIIGYKLNNINTSKVVPLIIVGNYNN